MIKVTAVNYLNTKPLLYGLMKSELSKQIDLQLDIPSICAQKLERNEVDLGLVPVAVIPKLTNPHIISDYCIGSVGKVATVCIYSQVPIHEIKKVYLDFHSKTSAQLTKILMKNHWKTTVQYLDTEEGFIEKISGTTAGLIIGDRAIEFAHKFSYSYDLGEAWLNYTGLPFTFAAWVSNKPLETSFVNAFNDALQVGINAISELLFILPTPANGFDLQRYFVENISYQFDTQKKKALYRFLQEMKVTIQPTLSESLTQ